MQPTHDVQRAYQAWLSAGKSESDKEHARARDAESHAELKALARLNDQCADCTATRPGWAALPHGVFVCIDCAQLHRGLGRHLSQVKAFNTGTYLWFPAELAVMRAVGNARSNERFCAAGAPPKPSQDAAAAVKLAYVRDKYEARRWYAEPTPQAAPAAQLTAPSVAAPALAPLPRPGASRSGLPAAKRSERSLLDDTAAEAPLDLLNAPIEQTLHLAPAMVQTASAPAPTTDAFAHKKSAVLAAFSGALSLPQQRWHGLGAPQQHAVGIAGGCGMQRPMAAVGIGAGRIDQAPCTPGGLGSDGLFAAYGL